MKIGSKDELSSGRIEVCCKIRSLTFIREYDFGIFGALGKWKKVKRRYFKVQSFEVSLSSKNY